jgi:hypothetical protein
LVRNVLAIAFGLLFYVELVGADDFRQPFYSSLARDVANCNNFGECTADVGEYGREILLSCETRKAAVMWNRKRPGAFLIACDCECTSHDNVGWVIDLKTPFEELRIQKIHLGKSATIEGLSQRPLLIFDMMSSHSLCETVDGEELKKSIFVSLVKYSTGIDVDPYCFSPVYIVEGGGYLEAKASNTQDKHRELPRIEDSGSAVGVEVIQYIIHLSIPKCE